MYVLDAAENFEALGGKAEITEDIITRNGRTLHDMIALLLF